MSGGNATSLLNSERTICNLISFHWVKKKMLEELDFDLCLGNNQIHEVRDVRKLNDWIKKNFCKVKPSHEECKVSVFIYLLIILMKSETFLLSQYWHTLLLLSHICLCNFAGSSLLFCAIVFQLFSLLSTNLYLPYGRHHWQEACGSMTKFWLKWEIRCRDFLCETLVFLTRCWKYESSLLLCVVGELECDVANTAWEGQKKLLEAFTWFELACLWKLENDS